MTHTRPTTRRRLRAAGLVALLSAGSIGAGAVTAPVAGAQGNDISHRSRYGQAIYRVSEKNTRIRVATGWNDPAGGPVEKTLEVEVTQKWCDGSRLVERTMSGQTDDYFGKTNPAYGYSTSIANVTLEGTVTTTPAGRSCKEPQAEKARTQPVKLGALVVSDIRATGTPEKYTKDDGGEYTYQDATASGAILMSEFGSWYGFKREAREPGETWLWEGYWADARGVDVASLVPEI